MFDLIKVVFHVIVGGWVFAVSPSFFAHRGVSVCRRVLIPLNDFAEEELLHADLFLAYLGCSWYSL